MILTYEERKWCGILAIIMVILAAAYIVVVNELVLASYHMTIESLKLRDMCWIYSIPFLCLLYSLLLFILCQFGKTEDWDDRYKGSAYTGDKFSSL